MEWRTKLGALLGAGGLVLLAASAVVAVAPTYTIDVTKTADPASVPVTGGSVTYTVWVENTGTGFFQVVTVDDGMAGCTLGAPTGDDADGKLESGETWAYSCTVTGVMPGDQNTASANACHDQGACTDQHDATDSDSVTVTEGEGPPPSQAPSVAPSQAPSAPPVGTFEPTQENAGATEPTTDAEFGAGSVGTGPNTLLLVLSLGLLLASLVLITPAKPIRQR